MRPWPLSASIALALAGCGGKSSDLTDLAGNTGRHEVAAKAFGEPLPDLGAPAMARFGPGDTMFRRNFDAAAGPSPVVTGVASLGRDAFTPTVAARTPLRDGAWP